MPAERTRRPPIRVRNADRVRSADLSRGRYSVSVEYSDGSAVDEVRGSAFEERRHGLTVVAGGARHDLLAVLQVDGRLEPGDLPRTPHPLLRQGHAERSVRHHLVGLGERSVEQGGVVLDVDDEADTK